MEWRWQRRLTSELKAIEIIQIEQQRANEKNEESLNGVRDHKKKSPHCCHWGCKRGEEKAVSPKCV